MFNKLIKNKVIVFAAMYFCSIMAFASNISINISGVNAELKTTLEENLSLNKIDGDNNISQKLLTQETLDILAAHGYYNSKVNIDIIKKKQPETYKYLYYPKQTHIN